MTRSQVELIAADFRPAAAEHLPQHPRLVPGSEETLCRAVAAFARWGGPKRIASYELWARRFSSHRRRRTNPSEPQEKARGVMDRCGQPRTLPLISPATSSSSNAARRRKRPRTSTRLSGKPQEPAVLAPGRLALPAWRREGGSCHPGTGTSAAAEERRATKAPPGRGCGPAPPPRSRTPRDAVDRAGPASFSSAFADGRVEETSNRLAVPRRRQLARSEPLPQRDGLKGAGGPPGCSSACGPT